jgi:hypothetical protein
MTAKKQPVITPEKLNLHQRIRAIMADVTHLVKDGTIAFKQVSYKAVTEEMVTSTVRKALIEHGVTCVPTGNIEWNQVGTLNTIIMNYQLTNVDDPTDILIVPTIGQGADTQDKGTNKAMTGAFKYLLLRTFNIPTGDDPDKVSSNELKVKHDKDLKKKYEDLVKKNKALYSPLELKQLAYNPKWGEAKTLVVIAKLMKGIEERQAKADLPEAVTPETGKAVTKNERKLSALDAASAAEHAGQVASEEVDLGL